MSLATIRRAAVATTRFVLPDDGQLVRRRGAIPAALLAYHHVGYPLMLVLWDAGRAVTDDEGPMRVGPRRGSATQPRTGSQPVPSPADHRGGTIGPGGPPLPRVALVIPAHNEAQVIRDKVASTLALDYPRELLRIVVAADGCTDDTVDAAREAGADLVLDLPRGGKMAAQHAAIAALDEPIVAFSDANSTWDRRALLELVHALEPARVGYACGHVRFVSGDDPGATNQEGVYWRYEMAIRERESRLASVTAGNGAIYAIKRAAYGAYRFDPVMGHDLAMPFQLVRAGWRCVDVPAANAVEKMVPTIEGEHRRKRRMMSHAWPIVLHAGMLDLRDQPPRYAVMLVSHRWLRYGAPLVHGWLAASTLRAARRSRIARLLLAGQAALLAAALRPGAAPAGPLRKIALICRYYVATNTAIAQGLYDHVAHGTDAAWTPPEGTR